MDVHRMLLISALLVPAWGGAAEVYRWTDEQGRVFYGDRVPEGRKTSARPVDVSAPVGLSSSPSVAADADEPAPRSPAARPASRPQTRPAIIGKSQALPKPADAAGRCAAAWQRYNESYACFDAYRYGGVVRPEGYSHCQEVPMPTDC